MRAAPRATRPSGESYGRAAPIVGSLDAMSVTYVAFLRGINLGKRRVKNEQLSAIFGSLGFTDVKVLIASGNVVFTAPRTDEAALTATIEQALASALGFQVSTMLRRMSEIQAM